MGGNGASGSKSWPPMTLTKEKVGGSRQTCTNTGISKEEGRKAGVNHCTRRVPNTSAGTNTTMADTQQRRAQLPTLPHIPPGTAHRAPARTLFPQGRPRHHARAAAGGGAAAPLADLPQLQGQVDVDLHPGRDLLLVVREDLGVARWGHEGHVAHLHSPAQRRRRHG